MPAYHIKVTQVYRAERHAVLLVNAEDELSAKELIESGAVDLPSFDDPIWKTEWDLQNEEVHAQT